MGFNSGFKGLITGSVVQGYCS